MHELITPLNLAVLGGLVGGMRTAAKSEDNAFMRLTDIAIGAMAAASASHYVPATAPMSALIIGVVAGRSAGYATDIIYGLVPQLLPMLIKFLQSVQNNKGNDK